jgi:hypothetical protein
VVPQIKKENSKFIASDFQKQKEKERNYGRFLE